MQKQKTQALTTFATGITLRAASSATLMAVLVTVVGAGRKFV